MVSYEGVEWAYKEEATSSKLNRWNDLIKQAFAKCLPKDGSEPMEADLPLGNHGISDCTHINGTPVDKLLDLVNTAIFTVNAFDPQAAVSAGSTVRTRIHSFKLPYDKKIVRVDIRYREAFVRGATGDSFKIIIRDDTAGTDLLVITVDTDTRVEWAETPIDVTSGHEISIIAEVVSTDAGAPPTPAKNGNITVFFAPA